MGLVSLLRQKGLKVFCILTLKFDRYLGNHTMYLTLPVFLWLCPFSISNSFASISISWNSPCLFFLLHFFLFWLHCKTFITVLPGRPSTFFMVFFSDNILHETYTDLLSLSECLYLFVCSQSWYSSYILFTVITNVHVSSGLWDLIIFRHKFHEISQVVPGLSGVFSKWKLSEWKLNTETM